MEFEYWWLLGFPLFFVLGWVAARIDIKHLISESRALPRSYFRGLNFLLNEQPDKAIEAFIEVVKVDPETIELHFALGGLFRRRGETDRAIRMHRNLLERDDLAPEQRLHASFELGQDYLKAGLLDRAEEVLSGLTQSSYRSEALSALLDIYQQEKDWARAIGVAREMEAESGKSWQKEIAQYLCELAAHEATHSRPKEAQLHLEQALQANRRCVRASVQLGDLALAAGDAEAAIGHWKRIEQQNPAFLSLAARRLLDAHSQLGRAAEGLTMLRGHLASFASIDLLEVTFQATLEASPADGGGAEGAYRLVKEELRRNPTLLGLDRLLEAQIMAAPAERRGDLELVKNLVHSHTRRLARYRCEQCGFKARQFFWHCPGCGGWETYPPKRTEEYDPAP
jgi:lipopolysaccharide biosynthesis regulator YciM